MSARTSNMAARTRVSIAAGVNRIDWHAVGDGLDEIGVALTGPVLGVNECQSLIALYDDEKRFRSTIDMARHRLGEGQVPVLRQPATRRRVRAAQCVLAAPVISTSWRKTQAGGTRGGRSVNRPRVTSPVPDQALVVAPSTGSPASTQCSFPPAYSRTLA